MRVAFVVPSIGRLEGQGNVDRELLLRVIAAGHRVDLYAGLGEQVDGARLHRIPRLPAWQFGNQLIALVWTTLAMAGRRFDIVHADAGVTLRRADVMVCHTVTDRWRGIDVAEHGLRGLNAAIATRFKAWLEVRQYRRAGFVFANSDATAADLRARGVGADRIGVLPFGVDHERFRPPTADERLQARASFGIDDERFVVTTVGAHGPRKGVGLLTSILADGEHLIVAGDRRGSVTGPTRGSMSAPGKLTDVRRAYWAADAFAYPSRYDAFGLAILEAMACGLPVLVSEQAGAAAIVGDAGIVLPPGEGPRWREALDRLKVDRGVAEAMSSAARGIAVGREWDIAGAMLTDRYELSSASA